jgi:hypothetical protein
LHKPKWGLGSLNATTEAFSMKTMFFAAVLALGVAVLGSAQTTQDVYPQVHANEFVMGGGPNNAAGHLSGGVDFTLGISTLGTTHIRADEAFLDGHDIQLRGNVHLITGPDAGRLRVLADTIH